MKKQDINQLIHDLTKRFQIEEIYQWTYQRNGKKYEMLHIHIKAGGHMRMGGIRGVIARIVAEYIDVYFTLYYTKDVQHMIDQGMGRFFLICQPEHRVFQQEGLKKKIRLPQLAPSEISDKTFAYIEVEKQKGQSFLEGYQFYLARNNNAQAAFMLHQALELTLRIVLMALTGDEKHTHSHLEIMAHLKKFDSNFTWLDKKEKYKSALRKLDGAYFSPRYDQGFQANKEDLEAIHQLYEEMLSWVGEYQADLIQEIKHKLSPEYLAQQKTERLKENYVSALENRGDISHRELIVMALQVFCAPQSIRCFAYRNKQQQCSNLLLIADEKEIMHHYYLFIGVLENAIHLLQLQDKVNQLLPGYLTVTLIVETNETILRHVQQGQLFFCNVLRTGEVWLEEKGGGELDTIAIPVPNRSMTYLKKQWDSKVRNAKALCTIYHTIYNNGDEAALCCTLALAIEHVCMGLVRVCLGYCSPVLNLNYLMRFVDLLCPEVLAVYSLDSLEGREKFKLLNNAVQDFRYSPNYKVDEVEVLNFYKLTTRFIGKAEEFVSKHFETLSQPVLTD